jgi:hypothetical protein
MAFDDTIPSRYIRDSNMPLDEEGRVQYVARELDKVSYQFETLASTGSAGQLLRTRRDTTLTVAVTASDNTVEMSNTGTITCTLPNATSCKGLLLTLVKTGASGTLNIASVAAQTSKGVNRTATPWSFTAQWSVLQIQSNGTNWTTLVNGVPA